MTMHPQYDISQSYVNTDLWMCEQRTIFVYIGRASAFLFPRATPDLKVGHDKRLLPTWHKLTAQANYLAERRCQGYLALQLEE